MYGLKTRRNESSDLRALVPLALLSSFKPTRKSRVHPGTSEKSDLLSIDGTNDSSMIELELPKAVNQHFYLAFVSLRFRLRGKFKCLARASHHNGATMGGCSKVTTAPCPHKRDDDEGLLLNSNLTSYIMDMSTNLIVSTSPTQESHEIPDAAMVSPCDKDHKPSDMECLSRLLELLVEGERCGIPPKKRDSRTMFQM